MSAGGGNGGDDDDLKEEMRRLTRKIDRLADAIIEGAQAEAGSDDEPLIDQWSVGGSPAGQATNVRQYITLRSTAAKNESVVTPSVQLDGSEWDSFPEAYSEVFLSSAEHLEAIDLALGQDDFDIFVNRLMVRAGVPEETVRKAKGPNTSGVVGGGVFGISSVGDDIFIDTTRCPLNFVEMYGSTWYFNTAGVEIDREYKPPNERLGLKEPPDRKLILSDTTVTKTTGRLAQIARDNGAELTSEERAAIQFLDDNGG